MTNQWAYAGVLYEPWQSSLQWDNGIPQSGVHPNMLFKGRLDACTGPYVFDFLTNSTAWLCSGASAFSVWLLRVTPLIPEVVLEVSQWELFVVVDQEAGPLIVIMA